jgi:nickel/cobalt exporter
MDQIISLLSQGSSHVWLFLPSAILLGVLHGLEPGHSKTMMAAFIVAVRGTVAQAALLGLSAAFSHTLIIWLLAAFALYFGRSFNVESTEPYFQAGAGVIVLGTAAWMAWRTWRDVGAAHDHEHEHHDHDHDHPHDHDEHGHEHPELEIAGAGYQDAHERAHALEIERRFAGRTVTTGQIVLFGLTGGLMPCPAAFSILLLCLQLKKFTIGFALVLCFSIGLAVTLVTVGVAAAWSVNHVSRRWHGFAVWARRAPFFSSGLLAVLGGYLLFLGLRVLLQR